MDTRILRIVAATLTALAFTWYLPGLVQAGLRGSAVGYILGMGCPPLIGLGLTFVSLRAGAVLIGLTSVVWAYVGVGLIVAGNFTLTGDTWLDTVIHTAGIPVALVGIVTAVGAFRFAKTRRGSPTSD